ncbi:MAG: methyltransferase domain-containing protein, partial [Candidatus Nanopelagicales bacterium]
MQQPWIASPQAAPALAWAEAHWSAADALRLGVELERGFGLAPQQRAAVLTQAELRQRAAGRWNEPHGGLFFTRPGLEQATRPALARWRAERLRGYGVRAIADLGCGLGLEALALAGAGLLVTAVELDAETAALAQANLAGLVTEVRLGDVTDPALLEPLLAEVDAVFLDPARRDPAAPRSIDGRSGQRVSDPSQWSPPWSWITALAA